MSEPVRPTELFKQLKLRPDGQIKGLWDIQTEVLNIYYTKLKDLKRVAIELPTGSGKSIISLLILEMWRRTGKRVAILTSSIALSNDMKRRCEDLGIPNVVITGRREGDEESRERVRNIRDYKRNNAVGIMNYWAYMMGRDIAMPDILAIDDADSFENLLIDQHSVVVKREVDPEIYNQTVKDLTKHRIYQRLETFGTLPSSEEVQLIYFPHSFEMANKITKTVSSRGRSGVSEGLFWSVERNKDALYTYLMFVSGNEIVFTPYIITGSMHERLRNVPHLIFTSATLGTAERIHKTMGSFDNIAILAEKDIKSQVGTMGIRVIFPLTDVSTTGKIDVKVLEAVNLLVNTYKKALVLCNSRFDANKVIDYLQDRGHNTILYQTEADSTRFATVESEGALVAAGRFIGLDLSSQNCRVCIVTRMPYVLGPVDLLIRTILEDGQYSDEKVSHRLVQGFGRCNRSPDDCAIYFVLDGRLANDMLGEERIYQHFPKRMKAELDFGQEFAEVGGMLKAIEVGSAILGNKVPEIESEIQRRIGKVSGKRLLPFEKPYIDEISGWYDLTERRNYPDAIKCFAKCIESYEQQGAPNPLKDRQVAWLHYIIAQCCYLAFTFFRDVKFKEKALENLESAMKSGYTSWFSGLQVVINELKEAKEEEETIFNIEIQSFREALLRKWNEFYLSNSTKKRNPLQTWERMREVLTSGSHDAICDTLEQVLELMGFEVSVIKHAQGKPDLLVFSNVGKRYLSIVEVKSKETGDVLKTEDVDQIGGHKTHYQNKYPDKLIYPLVYTTKSQVAPEALTKAKNSVRILRGAEFTVLMNKFIELMEKGWTIEDAYERLAFMDKILALEKFEVLFGPSETPIVSLDDISSIM